MNLRIRDSENLRISRNGETQDTQETQEGPPLGACVKTLQEAAQIAILDRSAGDPVFKLCRALKAFEKTTGIELSEQDRSSAFACWWNSPGRPNMEEDLTFEEREVLFQESFKLTRMALGENAIEIAVRNLDQRKPPPEAQRYASPRLKKLVHLCFELQLLNNDDPFFLGSRDAGKIIGCAHIHAAGFLKALVTSGLLTVVSVGHRGKASRYRFNRQRDQAQA